MGQVKTISQKIYIMQKIISNIDIPKVLLTRNDLPKVFKDMGYKVGTEIGVYQGEFTKKFCEMGLKMYAIDPWAAYLGAGRSENKTDKQDLNYDIAQKTLSPYPDCKLIRKSSMDALEDFTDESLDFVYIDGDHRFRYIAEDLTEWYKKIKSGGAISGHDYFCTSPNANNVLCHVKHVVDAFVKTYELNNLYVIGQNDKTPSWVIIKP